MVMHALGLLFGFAITSWVSATVSITPLAFAFTFGNLLTFVLCLIPGYIAAWMLLVGGAVVLSVVLTTLMVGFALIADQFKQRF